jgi:hypothetical protein
LWLRSRPTVPPLRPVSRCLRPATLGWSNPSRSAHRSKTDSLATTSFVDEIAGQLTCPAAADPAAQTARYRPSCTTAQPGRHSPCTTHDHDSGLFIARRQAETSDSKPLTDRTRPIVERCIAWLAPGQPKPSATAAPPTRLVVAPRVPEVNLRRLIALELDYINGAWTIPATTRPNSNNSHTSTVAVDDP